MTIKNSPTAVTIVQPTPRWTDSGEKILCLKEVEDKTGLAKATIYRRLHEIKETGDTSLFPIPVEVSKGRIGWLASEVDTWIRSRPRAIQPKTTA
jgi:predicted DNA-binding transcriptional regulator AlpA